MGNFCYKGDKFYLNGEKFNVWSGAVHYFRMHKSEYRDILAKLKACGLNTVETYVAWNLHEKSKGEFSFCGGDYDLVDFLRAAQELGLYVILRPGPFICAEFDFGGLPAWLLAENKCEIRCYAEPYMTYLKRYLAEVFKAVKPYLITNGGNIIMMQVENEYGSYGNDKKYLNALRDYYIECGIDVLLFTSDGNSNMLYSGGSIDGCLPTANFGSKVKKQYLSFRDKFGEKYPFMCTEFWCGWFDHWGEEHHVRSSDSVVDEIRAFIDLDANFNFYMFFGGTNFAFNSGANDDGTFQPTTTSYDYCAPLNEQGEYTDVYFKIRELLWSIRGENPPVLPPVSSAQKAGDVVFTQSSSLKANEKTLGVFNGYSTNPPSLEECGFSHGVIEYKTRLTGKYFDYDEVNAEYLSDVIKVDGIGDVAYVYENGEYLGKFDRVQNTENSGSFKLNVGDDSEISVLVDTYGHTNYGKKIIDPKGIKGVYVWNQRLFGYETVCYPLDSIDSIDWSAGTEAGAPAFLKGEFTAEAGKKCFIMPKGLTRGYIWLNGFNLGRYNSMGPQKALYAPAALLKEKNEIVVLEFENIKGGSVEIVDSPIFERGGKV